MIGATYFSEIVNSRVFATVLLQFWALPLLITLYTFTTQTSPWVYFAVVCFTISIKGVYTYLFLLGDAYRRYSIDALSAYTTYTHN